VSLRVGLDLDGVIADFRTAFREKAHELAGRTVAVDVKTPQDGMSAAELNRVWAAIGRTPQWWITLRPYELGEIERLYRLSRDRRWEVYFLTTRPPSAGDTPQFQTQYWLEKHGFPLPSVLTVPGSRGDLAHALRLDVHIDDRLLNCMDVIAASKTKAIFLARDEGQEAREQALNRGIAVVATLKDAIDAVEELERAVRARRGPLARLVEWFRPQQRGPGLPIDPRESVALPVRDWPDHR
jgi:hypothetical protein